MSAVTLDLMEQGKQHANDERIEEALALFDEALTLHRASLGNTPSDSDLNDLGRILTNRALALEQLGRHEEMRSCIEEAVRIRRRLIGAGHEEWRHFLLNGLRISIDACRHLGDERAALMKLRHAARVARRLLNRTSEFFYMSLKTIVECAHADIDSSDHAAAEKLLDDAIRVALKWDTGTLDCCERDLIASAYIARHRCLEELGRCADAADAAAQAVALARGNHDATLCEALQAEAESLEHLGRFADALERLREIDRLFATNVAASFHDDAAVSLVAGRILARQKRYAEAIEWHETKLESIRMVTIARACCEAERTAALVDIHLAIADCRSAINDPGAVEHYRAAISLISSDSDDSVSGGITDFLVAAYQKLAKALAATGSRREAADVLAEARQAAAAHGAGPATLADLAITEAGLCSGLREDERAGRLLDEVVTELRAAGEDELQQLLAQALFARADLRGYQSRWVEALDDASRALAIWDRIGDGDDVEIAETIGRAWLQRADLLARLRNHEAALHAVDQAITRLRANKEYACALGRALNLRGDVLERVGRCSEAAASHDEAITCFEAAGETASLATAMADRAFSLLHVKRTGEAIELLRRADQLWLSLRMPDDATLDPLHVRALELLADSLARQGDLAGCLDVRERAVVALRAADAKASTLGDGLFQTAVALSRLDRDVEAIELYDEAIEMLLSREGVEARETLARALGWRGISLEDLGRFAEAADSFAAASDEWLALWEETHDEAALLEHLESRGDSARCIAFGGDSPAALDMLAKLDEEIAALEQNDAVVRLRCLCLMSGGYACEVLGDHCASAQRFGEAARIAARQYDQAGDSAFRCEANDARIAAAFRLVNAGHADVAAEMLEVALREACALVADRDEAHVRKLAEVHFVRGCAFEALDDCVASLEAFDEALESWLALAESGDADAKRAASNAYATRAIPLHHLGRVEEAIESASRAVELAREVYADRPLPRHIESLACAIEQKADLLEAVGKAPLAGWHRSEAKRLRSELEHDDE